VVELSASVGECRRREAPEERKMPLVYRGDDAEAAG
jgi:hypothetical protein